jgi:hypothetical protein
MMLAIILLGVGGLMLLLSLRSLRARRLKERYALLFAAVGVPFLGLALWPDAVGYVAGLLGIQYQTVVLLAVTTFFLLMNFNLLAIVSVQERRITDLAQIVGILGARPRSAEAPRAVERRRAERNRKAA